METRGSLPFNPTNRRLQAVGLGMAWSVFQLEVDNIEHLFETYAMMIVGKHMVPYMCGGLAM